MLREVIAAELLKAALTQENAQCGIVVVEAVQQAKPVLAGVDFKAREAAHAVVRREEIDLRAGGHAILARERLPQRRSHSALQLAQVGVGAETARRGHAHEGSGWL